MRAARGSVGGTENPGGEHRHQLHLGRQRANHLDALHRQEFADLLERDLGFAARQRLADRAMGRVLGLGRDLIGDAELLEQLRHVDAGNAGLRIHHRLRRQQRRLQRIDGADVRRHHAAADGDADRGFGEIEAAALLQHAARDQAVDRLGGEHREIAGLAADDLVHQHVGGRIVDVDREADLALGGRDQLAGHRLHAVGAKYFHRRPCPAVDVSPSR